MCLNFICQNLNSRNVFLFCNEIFLFLYENSPKVKINSVYFRNAMIAQHLLNVIRNMATEGFLFFSSTVYQPTEPDKPSKC